MKSYSILFVRPDNSRAELVAELQQETDCHWTTVEVDCNPGGGDTWPPESALSTSASHDAVLIQVPEYCPVADFATVVVELIRAHPDTLLFLLIDATRVDIVRSLSDICACGLLLPDIMTPPYMACRIRNEINRRRLQQDLHEANTFTSQVIGSAGEGIMVIDTDRRVVIWNRAMERLTGVASSKVLGHKAYEAMPIMAEHDMANAVQRALWGETDPTCDVRFRGRDSERTIWLTATFGPHRDTDGRIIGVIGLLHDVTQRKEAELAIRHMAFHDALTGLPNRRTFRERMSEAQANADRYEHSFAVMAVDLDRFKEVNDTYGHEAGDLLLCLFVERLKAQLRKGDLLARMGGDEFVLLLPEVKGEADVEPVAAKIVESLSEPFVIEGKEVTMTASIGYAIHPDDGHGSQDLFRRADRAMYRAKEAGRNRYCRSVPG